MRIIITLFFLFFAATSNGQSKNFKQLSDNFGRLSSNFRRFVKSSSTSEKYREVLDEFLETSNKCLKGDYGLSFEELSELRTMVKYCTSFSNFYYLAGAGSSGGFASAKDIRLVTEYFPDIRCELSYSYDKYFSVYLISIDEYRVFLGRHLEKGKVKRVHYISKLPNGNQKGYFGIAYKCFKKISDNSDYLNYRLTPPDIAKIEELGDDSFSMSCTDE